MANRFSVENVSIIACFEYGGRFGYDLLKGGYRDPGRDPSHRVCVRLESFGVDAGYNSIEELGERLAVRNRTDSFSGILNMVTPEVTRAKRESEELSPEDFSKLLRIVHEQ